jgi:hypothetical protein
LRRLAIVVRRVALVKIMRRRSVLNVLIDASGDDADARNVVEKLVDVASPGSFFIAFWEYRFVAWHSPTPKRSGASRAVQVRAGRRLR